MANEKIMNTRIQLKYDSYTNWLSHSSVILKAGEVAIAYLAPSHTDLPTPEGVNKTHPVLFKVGDGVTTFANLPWASALAADVYSWAKQENLPIVRNDEEGKAAGNVISGISWNAEGKIEYTTASVATSEGMAALQEALEAVQKDIADNRDDWAEKTVDTNTDTQYRFDTNGDKLVVYKTLYTLGAAGTEEKVGEYEFLTAEEVATTLESYYTKTEVDNIVKDKLHTEAEIRTYAADEINTLIGGADSADTIENIKTLIDYVNDNGADIAQLTADVGTANTNASAAVEIANTAASNAATAMSNAATALSTANEAKEAATTAQNSATAKAAEAAQSATDAATAKTGAESAKAAAETAQNKAEAAQGKAETAQSKAEEAQGKAEDAQAAAESARDAAAISESNAAGHAGTASTQAAAASQSAGAAAASAQAAATSETNAGKSAAAAAESATAAEEAKVAALEAQDGAGTQATIAGNYAEEAKADAEAAAEAQTKAEAAQAKAEEAQAAAEASNTSATAIANEAKETANAAKTASETATTNVTNLTNTINGYGDIVTHNVAEFATAAQGALADSAVQSVESGDGPGCIRVDGNDVAVTGLGGAAFAETTAFAPADIDVGVIGISASGTGDGVATFAVDYADNGMGNRNTEIEAPITINYGAITTAKIADKAVTTAKIADNAVGAAQTKAAKDYTGNDAEVWVFYCGTSSVLV